MFIFRKQLYKNYFRKYVKPKLTKIIDVIYLSIKVNSIKECIQCKKFRTLKAKNFSRSSYICKIYNVNLCITCFEAFY